MAVDNHQSLTGGSTDAMLRVLSSIVTLCAAFEPLAGAPPPPKRQFRGIWDTGATNSVVTQTVVDACELISHTFKRVHTAKGLVDNVPAYMVDIHLPPKMRFPGLEVTLGELPPGADALIGMDVIGCGDFAVTNHEGGTVFTFRTPSMMRIDFVKQTHSGTALPKAFPFFQGRKKPRR